MIAELMAKLHIHRLVHAGGGNWSLRPRFMKRGRIEVGLCSRDGSGLARAQAPNHPGSHRSIAECAGIPDADHQTDRRPAPVRRQPDASCRLSRAMLAGRSL
jgi:hypothetical protein